MKQLILAILTLSWTIQLCAETIKLADGQVFNDAQIISVTPLGVDISYKDKSGPVVRSIAYDLLPADLQKKYGFDPKKVAASKEKIATMQKQSWDHLLKDQTDKAYTSKMSLADKLKDLEREYDKKVAATKSQHRKENLSKATLTNMIYSHRRNVVLNVTRRVNNAALGEIVARDENNPKQNIIVIGAQGNPDEVWKGIIYPAGIRTDVDNFKALQVYCTSLQMAVNIMSHHLDRYPAGMLDNMMTDENPQSTEAQAQQNEDQAATQVLDDESVPNYGGWGYWYNSPSVYIYPNRWHHYYPYGPHHNPYHPYPPPHHRVYGGSSFRGGQMGGHFGGRGRR